MPLTLEEIKQQLRQVNEVDLLEILDISSEDLVDRFQDIIEDKIDTLAPEFEEGFDEGTEE